MSDLFRTESHAHAVMRFRILASLLLGARAKAAECVIPACASCAVVTAAVALKISATGHEPREDLEASSIAIADVLGQIEDADSGCPAAAFLCDVASGPA